MEEIRFETDCELSGSHFHSEMEILYVLTGRVTVIAGQTSISLKPEDLIVFNPFEHHELIREAGSHTVSGLFPVSLLTQSGIGEISCCSRLQRHLADYFPAIRAKLAMLYRDNTDQDDNRKLYAQSDAYGLLGILKEHFSRPDGMSFAGMTGDKNFLEILKYTEEHFSEPITLQDAAEAVFLSPGYLTRLFRKRMNVSFPEYLQTLRLNRAQRMLISTEQSVTDIAMDCGFSSVNTFILNFQNRYGQTPGQYRKSMKLPNALPAKGNDMPGISLTNLLKHTNYEERFRPLSKHSQKPTEISITASSAGEKLCLHHDDSISVGWAGSLLQEGMRNAVRRAVKEIGFRYVTLQGIFDDQMGVYYEMSGGEPALSFTYLDMILDFVLSTGAKPSPILSYIPSALLGEKFQAFGASYFGMPKDLDKWLYLVGGVIGHLIDRYGTDELNQWRFPMYPGVCIDFRLCDFEEYFPFYRRTFETVRNLLPDAVITGCQLDLDIQDMTGFETLGRFLKQARSENCLPDILTFQCFHMQYSAESLEEASSRIVSPSEKEQGEPAPCSTDPRRLGCLLDQVYRVMAGCGTELPVHVNMWNSTIWQADTVNDTCYKSAFLVKNYVENDRKDLTLTYSALTDNNERRVMNSISFHGGFGLMTYQGMPKAGYWAMLMLKKLGPVKLLQGDGYIVTRSGKQNRIQICLYNDCSYDREKHIAYPMTPEELCTFDRYSELEDRGIRGFQIRISGLPEGRYIKETWSISRAQGSSYDNWISIGAPAVLSRQQQEYLESTSLPGYQYEQVRVRENGELILSAVLDTLEIQMICLESKA